MNAKDHAMRRPHALLLLLLLALGACAAIEPETGEPVYNLMRQEDGM